VPYLFVAALEIALGFAAALAFAAAAAFIFWRRRRSTFATFVAIALLLRVPGFITDLPQLGAQVPAWAGPLAAIRSLDAVAALLFLFVFPDGNFVPSRARVLCAGWALWIFGTLATPQYDPIFNLDQPWARLTVALLALAGLAAQIYRYRTASTEHQRLQTKWIVYGLSIYVVVFAVQQLVPVLEPAVRGPGVARLWYRLIGDVANDLAATLVPLTIAIAILRAKLLGIDLIINQTIVYATVTTILAGVFAGASSAAQYVLGVLTGHGSDAVSIVLAAIVAVAFAPLRSYVQRVVDRRLAPRRA
jgi:two-component system, NarL family, sensor kinase